MKLKEEYLSLQFPKRGKACLHIYTGEAHKPLDAKRMFGEETYRRDPLQGHLHFHIHHTASNDLVRLGHSPQYKTITIRTRGGPLSHYIYTLKIKVNYRLVCRATRPGRARIPDQISS